jgi:hypothetical protein
MRTDQTTERATHWRDLFETVECAEIGYHAVKFSSEVADCLDGPDMGINASMPGDANHFRGSIKRSDTNTLQGETASIFTGSATEVEYAITFAEQRENVTPDGISLKSPGTAIGPDSIVVGGQ